MLPNDQTNGLAGVFGRLTRFLNRRENLLSRASGGHHSSQHSYGTFGDSGEEMENENRGSFGNFFARMDLSRNYRVRVFHILMFRSRKDLLLCGYWKNVKFPVALKFKLFNLSTLH